MDKFAIELPPFVIALAWFWRRWRWQPCCVGSCS
jgi:hypothetical protein